MTSLPGGTVTFLLTDVEDSSSKWEQDPDAMRSALSVHDELVEASVTAHNGLLVKHMGDGYWAAFASASDAASAAIAFQRSLQQNGDRLEVPLRARIGLHTGEVEPTNNDYFGPVPNRLARVANVANGNQIVCSAPTATLLGEGLDLRSAGLHELRGIGSEEIFIILSDEVITDDRPLRQPVAPSTIPHVHTTFHGRDAEIDEAVGYMSAPHSVVTLIGPGGVGKTRLAIAVAEHMGIKVGSRQFCDLAVIGDEDSVPESVAELIGARKQPGMDLLDSIADFISTTDMLLILDNCEHVIDAVRMLVARLERIDRVHILATSREALGLPDEQLMVVSPLPIDGPGMSVFVDRARQRDATFELTADNEEQVREIVRRLDGIPLAIELAAARIRVMTPSEIAERLDDRFRLLGGGRRRERHETLRAAVSWSYKLLTPAETALFTRLSVFAGGFNLAAAESIGADDETVEDPLVDPAEVADLLLALVDKSMVVSHGRGREQRFSMLETLRRFGEEQLADDGDARACRLRHAEYYSSFAARQNARMFSAEEPKAWAALDREWANLRTALDTFEQNDDDEACAELVLALVWFATMSMRFELFGWVDEVLDRADVATLPTYTDLCGAGALGRYLTLSGDVAELATRGLAADPSDPAGFCRTALASLWLNNLHTPAESAKLTEEWLDSNPSSIASRLWAHGFRTFHLTSYEKGVGAAEHAAACVALADQTKGITAHGLAAWADGLATTYVSIGAAVEKWTAGLEWPRSLGNSHLVEQLLTGLLLHFAAQHDELLPTLRRCREAVESALEQHYYAGTSHLFGVTAIVLTRAGDSDTGATLLGAMVANGHQPRPNAIEALRAAHGDRLDDAMRPGRELSVTGAAATALQALDARISDLEESP